MALSAPISDNYAAWLLAQRNGGKPSGVIYDCLVSDLAAGDYMPGSRATVVSTGSTTSGNRTLTLTRLGYTWTTALVAAHGVRIIR